MNYSLVFISAYLLLLQDTGIYAVKKFMQLRNEIKNRKTLTANEPHHEKNRFLYMRKQRRRSAER